MREVNKKDNLKICFMGGRQAGVIGALTALAKGADIIAAVSYSDDLKAVLDAFEIGVYKTVGDKEFVKHLSNADVLLSVHGGEIVEAYTQAFRDNPFFDLPEEKKGVKSAWHLYCIRLRDKYKGDKKKIFASLRERLRGSSALYTCLSSALLSAT
jgi:hypothetical protein